LVVCINHRAATESSIYEAARCAWKLNKARAEQAELVLATLHGEIIGVFVPERWLEVTRADFPERGDEPGRIGFVGHEAPPAIRRLYEGKRVPDEYRKPGAANPVRYTWRE